MTNSESNINFCYWLYNFENGWIQKVWADEPNLAQHFQEKFNGIVSRRNSGFATAGCVVAFIMELSTDNKTKLMNWIEANYNYQK